MNIKNCLAILLICLPVTCLAQNNQRKSPKIIVCSQCNGKGCIEEIQTKQKVTACSNCNAKGAINCSECSGSGRIRKSKKKSKRILGIKVGSKRIYWYETCSRCGGRGKVDCSKGCINGYFYKNENVKNLIPCPDKNCPGSVIDQKNYYKFHELVSKFEKEIIELHGQLSKKRKEKDEHLTMLEIISLEITESIIENKFEEYVEKYTKERLINLLSKKNFEMLEKMNEQLKNIPMEQRKRIISSMYQEQSDDEYLENDDKVQSTKS